MNKVLNNYETIIINILYKTSLGLKNVFWVIFYIGLNHIITVYNLVNILYRITLGLNYVNTVYSNESSI